MSIFYMDDPFSGYPELVKEREKARKLLEKEEKLGRLPSKRGGWRPNAGAKTKEYKIFRVTFVIRKEDEEKVSESIEQVRKLYGNRSD